MKSKKWKFEDIPNLSGKVTIVTGANSGTGFEIAKAFARKGAQVIMACRNMEKAEEALHEILAEFPKVKIEIMQLNLADLSSIKKFVAEFSKKYDKLDILCNNAGVSTTPEQKTEDGFELQFGTNHLGHFALTGLLLDTLIKTEHSRIVTMSSAAHNYGKIRFDDPNWEKEYNKNGAYGQSKLANLLFAYELQRKLETAGKKVISNASHPGWTRTNLVNHIKWVRILNPLIGMKPTQGALPMIYAATASEAKGGAYYGPNKMGGMRGYPTKVKSHKKSHNLEDAKRLWELSEQLTGIRYQI